MDSNDYNLIRPVKSLQNIAGLTPVQKRQSRKQKQKHYPGRHSDEPADKQPKQPEITENSNPDDPHSIDFRA